MFLSDFPNSDRHRERAICQLDCRLRFNIDFLQIKSSKKPLANDLYRININSVHFSISIDYGTLALGQPDNEIFLVIFSSLKPTLTSFFLTPVPNGPDLRYGRDKLIRSYERFPASSFIPIGYYIPCDRVE